MTSVSKTVWDLTSFFANDNDIRMKEERDKVWKENFKFINKWKDRTDYLYEARILKEALDEYEKLQYKYGLSGREGYYFSLRSAQDENNPQIKAKVDQIHDFSVRILNERQFFILRLSKIDEVTQKKFLSDRRLIPYKHFLENLFAQAKFTLSESEEKIINLFSSTSYNNWVRMTSGFLSKEEGNVIDEDKRKKKLPLTEIQSLLLSHDKKVRDSACWAINKIIQKHIETGEAEINAVLQNKKILDELRVMNRPDLSRHLSDNMDSETVDALISAVSGRFDIPARFYKFKARLLGLPKLGYHERMAEYGVIDKKYSYNETVKLTHEVFWKLDRDFAKIMTILTTSGKIDVFPRKGKSGGAFCAHDLISQPTYILLNHTGRLMDVLTFAHELGHAINNELIKEKQNALNFGTPGSTAEVASTFMEDFVLQRLMTDSDDELRLSLMMMKLNEDVFSIFRQAACYRFEQELHLRFREKGYLSKESIGILFKKHMELCNGPYVDMSHGTENWWLQWPHIRYFFYVYSYASGLLISKGLQNAVKKQPAYIDNVKSFLSAGLSDSPKNIFRKMGIDIVDVSFWNKGLDEVEKLLTETITLSKQLRKIPTNAVI